MEQQTTIKNVSRKQMVKYLFADLAQIKWWLLLGALLCLASTALAVIAPMVMGLIVDVIDLSQQGAIDFEKLTNLLILLLILYVASSGFAAAKSVLLNNIVSRYFTCKIRIKMSEKIKSLPISYVDTTKKGEIIERMTEDVSTVGATVHQFIDMFVNGFLQLVAIIGFMLAVNWQLALIGIIIIPFSVGTSIILAKKLSKFFDSYMLEFGKIYTTVDEAYSGLKTVRTYNCTKRIKQQFDVSNEKIRQDCRHGYFLANSIQPIVGFINKIGYVLICLLGGYLAINGESTSIGDIIAIVLYTAKISEPLEAMAYSMAMMQRAAAAASRVYGMFALDEMTEVTSSELPEPNIVEFENVDFSYTEDKPIITNLNLKIERGQKIAIVGPTGGGKTTIVNLLMRFYDPTNGKIKLGGVDITTLQRQNIRDMYSMVLQDTWLFSGTIAANIAYGKPDATREQVICAAKDAYCDGFISSLPNGYDTEISEDANNISGGQKQLITIARAILAGRPMIILDEATSNVDTRTEILLQKAMDKLMMGRTCFVIAHRLSTIVNADRILVIRDGNVVEQGTHQELLEKHGFYYDIYQSQYAIG